MKIFYCCSTGTYTSLVAANYHLGVISPEMKYDQIINLPNFDALTDDEIGQPIFVGADNLGTQIYTFGVKEENILLTNAMIDWLKVLNIAQEEYKIVDLTGIKVNYLLKTGKFLSMNMKIKSGRKLAAKGLRIMLPSIAEIVDRVKGGTNLTKFQS